MAAKVNTVDHKAIISAKFDKAWDHIVKLQKHHMMPSSHKIHTPRVITKKLVKEILKNTDTTNNILVLYNVEFVLELLEQNRLMGANTSETNITFYSDDKEKTEWVEMMGVKVITELPMNKLFDVVIGNPPFNTGSDVKKSNTGVEGDTKKFKFFTNLAATLVRKDGYVALITPKGIINTLLKDKVIRNYEVKNLNFMSELNVWEYDTCYFVLQATAERTSGVALDDMVLGKMLDITCTDTFTCKLNNKSEKEMARENVFGPNGVDAIRYLPGSRGDNPIYDSVANTRYMIPAGPKVVGTALSSTKSIIATDSAVAAGTVTSYITDTMAEAEALAKFILNNKAVKYFNKAAKIKKPMNSFKWVKRFDLSQIVTGEEYPVEWGFTAEEIAHIEANI